MKNKLTNIIKTNWLIILITFIALVIRSINLGFLSLWVDEYVHAIRAIDFLEEGKPIFTNDNNGILLTFFIIPLYKIFGYSEITTRIPSLMFGVATIPLIYLFAKKLFNKQIGIISMVILTFSLYHVFWSKIGRNYAIFMFFYLLSAYLLYLALNEYKNQRKTLKPFKILELNQKYLLLFFLSFILSFLSHQLSFFMLFSLGFYCIFILINRVFQKKEKNREEKRLKYLIVAIPSIILFIGIFSESFGVLLSNILKYMLPENVVSWIIPDWIRLNEIINKEPYKIYDLYLGVLKTDLAKLYILGFIGFIISFFYNRKSGIFIFSFFLPIFLLMSFVFRDPALPRYEIFIYPFFIVALAVSIHFIYFKVIGKILSEKIVSNTKVQFIAILGLILILPSKEIYSFTVNKKHGRVVPKELTHWYFTNWKDSSLKIKDVIQPNDKIITTGVANMKFYLGINPIHYRQRRYDGALHKYVNIDATKIPFPHANSFEGVKQIIENNDRVWLVVDYYFDGVFSDPQTKSYLINKMEYMPQFSNKDTKVFLYDKSKPKTRPNQILEVLNYTKSQTQEYFININQFSGNSPRLIIEAEGLNFTSELKIIINKKNVVFVNHQSGNLFNSTKNSSLRQYFSVPVDRKWLVQGQNSLIFQYNTDIVKEELEGVTLYNIQLNP